ncbi:hypothetical protein ACJX0J_018031, partial [Zea mays]
DMLAHRTFFWIFGMSTFVDPSHIDSKITLLWSSKQVLGVALQEICEGVVLTYKWHGSPCHGDLHKNQLNYGNKSSGFSIKIKQNIMTIENTIHLQFLHP